jgi:hypothetical protein
MHRRTNTGEDIFIQATELKYLYVRNLHGMPSYFFIEPLRPHPPPPTDEENCISFFTSAPTSHSNKLRT